MFGLVVVFLRLSECIGKQNDTFICRVLASDADQVQLSVSYTSSNKTSIRWFVSDDVFLVQLVDAFVSNMPPDSGLLILAAQLE